MKIIKLLCFSLSIASLMACQSSEQIIEKTVPQPQIPTNESIGTGGYTYSLLGSAADVTTTTMGATICAGGGTDFDAAMTWMLQQSGGGDIVVIRNAQLNATPSATYDAYNDYFKNQLGVTVNSVETIFLNNKTVAQNQEVINKVKAAECLFFTGGDQATYYSFIEGTGLEDAINYLKNTKKVPVGGTSAGCAIQGKTLFTAANGTITSADALLNPYNSKVTLQRDNFMDTPYLGNTITDTHFNNPDRRGRLMTFMARMSKDYNVFPRGIGIDEQTVVCIQANGNAKIFGNGYAFFCEQNYTSSGNPETCVSSTKLDWYRSQKAVYCHRVQGSPTGANTFNVSSWTPGSSGVYSQYYYVDKGTFGRN
jgi:cyanophycinase